jgi:Holliday junction resolvasome RuvABC DNA-binding subunit
MAKVKKHHPAAFINVIAEEGTKEDAVQHLQQTWNNLMNLHIALVGLGFTKAQINKMQNEGILGKVF